MLRELLYIYERNPSEVEGLINYKKFELMAFHMMRVVKFQSEVGHAVAMRRARDA